MKYVKNPIEITAIQYKHDGSLHSYIDEQNGLLIFSGKLGKNLCFDKQQVFVNTNHGAVSLNNGDYLIKSHDEVYPCSQEIFEKNYTAAPSTWLDRVKLEQAELQIKLDALDKTLNVPAKPAFITEKQWIFMTRQQFHMRQYNQILLERIADAEAVPDAPAEGTETPLQGSESNLA